VLQHHNCYGSANPSGGDQHVKWKWGAAPDEMLYKNQPGFIKFALGENVKQSNWELITLPVSHKLEWELSRFLLITFNVLENTKRLGNIQRFI
jgi:hypothetical protein